MDVVSNNYMPGDPRLIDHIVYELKAQGIFDNFRKECIADVDTKPAYQNLRQRVEGSVIGFLKTQQWKPDMNKNQVREMLRKNISESGFLETGVERIVDQVVNPKINSIFLPQVENVVYKVLGIHKPSTFDELKAEKDLNILVTNEKLDMSSNNLLPSDLEAVSPESEPHEKKMNVSNESQKLDNSRMDEDESPPFEPLEESTSFMVHEDNSVDSHLSGFSGLASHDSNHSFEVGNKIMPMEISNQDSQFSKQSSDDHLSIIVMSDETETKMEANEDSSQSKISKATDSNSKSFDFMQDTQASNDKSSQSSFKQDKNDAVKKIEDKPKSYEKNEDKPKSYEKSEDKPKSYEKNDEKKEKHRSSDKHRPRQESKSESKDRKNDKDKKSSDRDKKEHRDKSKYSSKDGKDRDKDRKDGKSESKSDKDHKHEKERDRNKNSSSKHSSSKDKSSSRRDSDLKTKEKPSDSKTKELESKEQKTKESEHKDSKTKESEHKDSKTKDSEHKDSKTKESKTKDAKEKIESSRSRDGSKSRSESKSHSSTKNKSDSKNHSKHNGKNKSESSDLDKSSSKSSKKDEKSKKDDKHHSRSEKYSSSVKKDEKRDKDKRDPKKDIKKMSKDDHYGLKGKNTNRRSTDRDSSDGHSGTHSSSSSLTESSTSLQKTTQESSAINSRSNSGDSGNSDQVDGVVTSTMVPVTSESQEQAQFTTIQQLPQVKLIKPKFASNIFEARRLMKIRKKLGKLEKQNQMALMKTGVALKSPSPAEGGTNSILTYEIVTVPDKVDTPDIRRPNILKKPLKLNSNRNLKVSTAQFYRNKTKASNHKKTNEHREKVRVIPERTVESEEENVAEVVEVCDADETISAPLQNSVISKASWDAVEAKLLENVMKAHAYPNSFEHLSDIKVQAISDTEVVKNEDCLGFPKETSSKTERYLEMVHMYMSQLEENIIMKERHLNRRRETAPTNSLDGINRRLPKVAIVDVTSDSEIIISPRRGIKRHVSDHPDVHNNNIRTSTRLEEDQLREKLNHVSKVNPSTKQSVPSKAKKAKVVDSTGTVNHLDTFNLPLSPAESDKSFTTTIDKKNEKDDPRVKRNSNINRAANNSCNKRYSTDDLYKPRLQFSSSRRRAAKNRDAN